MSYRDVSIPPDGRRALEALDVLSKKWSPIVVLSLQRHGTQGFSDLLDGIPDISSKVLSDTLTSLQETGLIERRVLRESPLRVEYERTEAGRELEPVFETLAGWAEAHLEPTTRTVLIADRDRRITDMYREWLTDRYTVLRAHDDGELIDRLDDEVDVVLLDIAIPGVDVEQLVSRLACRTILVVGDRPDPDLASIECDHVLRKPFVRETALSAVGEQIDRTVESAAERKRASLIARRSFFESIYSQDRLAEHEAYRDVLARLDSLGDPD